MVQIERCYSTPEADSISPICMLRVATTPAEGTGNAHHLFVVVLPTLDSYVQGGNNKCSADRLLPETRNTISMFCSSLHILSFSVGETSYRHCICCGIDYGLHICLSVNH